ncbi:MAG: DNA methyltransferase [Blastocatellia bacterium]
MEKNMGHPAVFPVDLPIFFIKLLCPEDGFVVDPFGGSGSTGVAALSLGRRCVLIDNNPQYCREARRRLSLEEVPDNNLIPSNQDSQIQPLLYES